MNIMRKLLVGPPRPMPVANPQQNAQHTALGLMHLRKLFSEYSHPQVPFTQKEQEDHLYNMLPLFCRVFGSCPAKDITEKFGDVLAFCQQVAKLMVSEIRRRASNQSTEAASLGIVKFLEIESTEESSNGWMLLSTINLLASGDESLIEVLTAASLPSTLVKCLYLFFDLPKLDEVKNQPEQSEFTAEERRILLQKIFVQVLIRLTSHSAAAEELARKDDLTLLFSATTSWCPPHNVAWRKSAAEVLMTLSRHGLSPPVITYIHHKGCVALCVDNMQRVQELSPLEIVEMFVTIFCFLKDSAEVAQTLLDDFRACQGYIFVSEFLLRLEQDKNEEAKEALRNLVFLVASLTTCGFVELKPSQASTTGSLFQIPGFQLPYPSGRGMSVRNVQAFQVLQSVFLKSNTSYLNSVVLDVISGIYNSEDANYFILEPQYALSQLAEKIHLKSPDVQMKFFGLLEFIVFHLKFIPCKEFISLSLLLKAESSVEFSIACMQTLLKFVKHNAIFKDVYREVGLLEVIVSCLHRYAALLKESQNKSAESESESGQSYILGSLVMDALALILSGNSSNADLFRECGGARCAHNMVPYLECRQQALNIVQQLVLCNGGDDDMGTLLAMMHTAPVAALELKTHILKALLTVLRESHRTRTVFRKVGGFVYVMSVLVSMEGCLSAPPKSPWDKIDEKQILSLLRIVLTTLTIAMRFEPANAKYFAQE
uniref:Alfy-like armadillo-like repeat domain-containing protein n=1 Tax=Strigamia maritima TaxID=126957 RepID=T1IYC2_STRMM